VPELSLLEALLRLALAGGLGAAVGLERELREREAGLRTHLLVALGSCLFTIVSAYAWQDWRFSAAGGVTFDPTRIAAQVVSGIGFLGAGAIIVRGLSVRGLTTAATLWVVAAIGMAAGAGLYWEAAGATTLVIVTLAPLRFVMHRLLFRLRPHEGRLVITVGAGLSRTAVLDEVERLGGELSSVEFVGDSVVVDLRGGPRARAIAGALADADGVERVEWRP